MEELELIARARLHANAIAIRSDSGEHSYLELLDRSETLATALLDDSDDPYVGISL